MRTLREARIALRRRTGRETTSVDLTLKARDRGDHRVGSRKGKRGARAVARVGRSGQDLSIRSRRIQLVRTDIRRRIAGVTVEVDRDTARCRTGTDHRAARLQVQVD